MANPQPLLTEPTERTPSLCSVYVDDPARPALEQFVRAVFRRSYGAEVSQFTPELLGDFDLEGRLRAVVGARPANHGALFCEHYLERPLEQELSARIGGPVPRSELVEVGHLAPESAGQARALIAALTRRLAARGYRWVAFTAVPRLRNAFARMQLEIIDLGAADPQRLPAAERALWGSYYANRPRVYAGDIRRAQLQLELTPHPSGARDAA